jgi:hypothetical protein
MEWDVNVQLRITTWPGIPLPLPPAAAITSDLDRQRKVIVPAATRDEADSWDAFDLRPVRLSGQTYLRLAEVDLEDPDAILGFVNSYGTLDGADAYAAVVSGEHTQLEDWCEGALRPGRERLAKKQAIVRDELRVLPIRLHWSNGDIEYGFSVTEILEGEPNGPDDEEWSRLHVPALLDGRNPTLVETLSEFRFAAYCLRDVEVAWHLLRSGGDPEGVVLDSVVHPPEEGWDPLELSNFLIGMLSCLLRPLSPQLGGKFHMTDGNQPATAVSTLVEPLREAPDIPLYTLCALELFNHILEGVEYRFCQNERCGRRFVHQEGRSKKGQSRSRGVIYCSDSCARATA